MLLFFLNFNILVTAQNKFGPSLVVPEIVEGRTGEGDPGGCFKFSYIIKLLVIPKNFRLHNATSTTADFLWDRVDRTKVQGNFTGYKVNLVFI